MIFPADIQLGPEYQEVIGFLGSNPARGISLTRDICGIPHRFGRGGVHAALDNFAIEESEETKIIDIDFSSFYPFIMLRYVPWFWTGMSREQYMQILIKRINAKFNGASDISNALKRTVAVSYGLARRENEAMGYKVCAIGQLILVDLLDKLKCIQGIKLINSNTDGVILAYPRTKEEELIDVVERFRNRIKIPIEYLEIHKLQQKNINCYVAELGESYIIKNGSKTVIKEDIHNIKTKGFPKDIPDIVINTVASAVLNHGFDEGKILVCNDLSAFSIRKEDVTEKDYRWQVSNKFMVIKEPIDIYATTDARCGSIGTLNGTALKPLPYTSSHSVADTKGVMKLEALDKEFYLNMARELRDKWGREFKKEGR